MGRTRKPGWWQRNWPWAIPAGGLGLFGLFIGTFAIVAFALLGTVKNSDVYAGALALARSDPRVVDELGEPIKAGWTIEARIDLVGASGEAELSIPITGPKGSGRLLVFAERRGGEWIFERLEVKVRGNERRIDLLADDNPIDWVRAARRAPAAA